MGVRPTLLTALLAAAILAAPMTARADDDDDQDVATDLAERGEIHSLAEILKAARRSHVGEVIAVDLLRVDGAWVYRLQIVAPDGRRTILDVNAEAEDALGGRD